MKKVTIKHSIGLIIVSELIASMFGLVTFSIAGSFMIGFELGNVANVTVGLIILLASLIYSLFEE